MTTFLESYVLEGAQPILKHGGEIVGTVNSYGKGKAYLLGTAVGQSIFMNDIYTETALTKILDNEKIDYCYKDNLIIRKHEYKDKGAVVIINPTNERISQRVSFEKKIKVIQSYDAGFSYNLRGTDLSFQIGPEDANCIVYEKA